MLPTAPSVPARTLRVSGLALLLAATVAACRGSPPNGLAGFRLGMTQEQVLAEGRRQGDFTCNIRGTVPRLMTCHGPTAQGQMRVSVHDDVTTYLGVYMDVDEPRPERVTRRFVRRFGTPVWRERPHRMPFDSIEAFHTFWLARDSTRGLGMTCVGVGLEPPCFAELTRTTPAAVEAKLDSLLQIRR
jgi:hypothetical protein